MKNNKLSEKLKADIVIVGGGGSGLAAAVGALEKGAKNIIIIEKYGKLGGNAVNPGGIFGVETPLQRRMSLDVRKDEVFMQTMDYAHWKLNGRLIRTLIDRSGDTIQWLEHKGVHFTDLVAHHPNQFNNAYHVAGGAERTGTQIVKALSKECLSSSAVRILFKTSAEKILMDKKGKIAGILATGPGGEKIQFLCKSVILCTGGFSGNEELIKKYDPTYSKEDAPPLGIPHNGDGLRMAEEIGAALDGMIVYEWGAFFAGTVPLSVIIRRPYTLWMNTNGDRFINEGITNSAEIANAVYRQPGRVLYCLFDEEIKKRILSQDLSPYEILFLKSRKVTPASFASKIETDLKKGVTEGSVKISDKLNDIARWMGIKQKELHTSLKEYNKYCAQGRDGNFVKDPFFLSPVQNPPYYVIRCALKLTMTHGGIKINHRMEAMDMGEKPIAGLYAAGVETGATDSNSYNMELSGHSFGFAINSGRIAGEKAAEYIANNQ